MLLGSYEPVLDCGTDNLRLAEAAVLVLSVTGAILGREKTSEVFAFSYCLGVHRRCGQPGRRQDGEEAEGVGRHFCPLRLFCEWRRLWGTMVGWVCMEKARGTMVGWVCMERAVGNHGDSELAKVIGTIFDVILEVTSLASGSPELCTSLGAKSVCVNWYQIS